MMAGKDRVGQIVKASLAGLAHVALTLGLSIVAPLLSKLKTITPWTTDTVWPAQGANGLKTFSVIDEGLYMYHDASIAY